MRNYNNKEELDDIYTRTKHETRRRYVLDHLLSPFTAFRELAVIADIRTSLYGTLHILSLIFYPVSYFFILGIWITGRVLYGIELYKMRKSYKAIVKRDSRKWKLMDQYEIFCDESYYGMWAVRPQGDRNFFSESLKHFDTEHEAREYVIQLGEQS